MFFHPYRQAPLRLQPPDRTVDKRAESMSARCEPRRRQSWRRVRKSWIGGKAARGDTAAGKEESDAATKTDGKTGGLGLWRFASGVSCIKHLLVVAGAGSGTSQ